MDELKKAQESNSTIYIHFVLNNPLIYSFGIMYEKQLNICTSVNHSVLDSNWVKTATSLTIIQISCKKIIFGFFYLF